MTLGVVAYKVGGERQYALARERSMQATRTETSNSDGTFDKEGPANRVKWDHAQKAAQSHNSTAQAWTHLLEDNSWLLKSNINNRACLH